jgi:hypothetical protein
LQQAKFFLQRLSTGPQLTYLGIKAPDVGLEAAGPFGGQGQELIIPVVAAMQFNDHLYTPNTTLAAAVPM